MRSDEAGRAALCCNHTVVVPGDDSENFNQAEQDVEEDEGFHTFGSEVSESLSNVCKRQRNVKFDPSEPRHGVSSTSRGPANRSKAKMRRRGESYTIFQKHTVRLLRKILLKKISMATYRIVAYFRQHWGLNPEPLPYAKPESSTLPLRHVAPHRN